MQTDDIAAWLTQIWDEQEQAEGRRFRSRKDVPQPSSVMHGWPEDDCVTIRRYDSDSETAMRHVDYIAEFLEPSPDQFTLARIAADRAILAECSIVLESKDPKRLGERILAWAVVRQLASVHRDRPNWREAWQ